MTNPLCVPAGLWRIVYSSFEDVVMRGTDDVLTEVYVPHCPSCRALAPRLRMLAALLKEHGVKTVRIAIMV